jgi:Domain of unknown function (DUF1842)
MSTTEPLAGLYPVKGILGNVGVPGAPICHFNLLVYPSGHTVSGIVNITQAIAGPESHITVQVHGKIYATGLGKVTQVVSLQGQYGVSFPPPAIGTYLASFEAHMAIDNDWNGKGGFEYGGKHIEDVPVTKTT